MADPDHLKIYKEGTDVWNRWREAHPDVVPDLSGADLSSKRPLECNNTGTDFRSANLSHANLSYACLDGSDFTGADLQHAILEHAMIRDANLQDTDIRLAHLRFLEADGSDFTRSNLRLSNLSKAALYNTIFHEADLLGADLIRTNLYRADLKHAELGAAILRGTLMAETKFTNTHLGHTIFAGVNLEYVIDLDTCQHVGPSYIDFHTLQHNHPLPLPFLRGCGLPDDVIDYLPALTALPIRYNSCFISHSHKDHDFAQRLYNDLQSNGVRCWFAPEDMKGGEKLFDQIDQAIHIHDKLLVLLSDNSIASNWVGIELREALKREKQEKRRILFPIGLTDIETLKGWRLFDADEGRDIAAEVRSYYIPDFSEWKNHDVYMKAFGKLVKALEAG